MLPKKGLYYSDVAKRINRIKNISGNEQAKLNLISSLRNQCRIAEGDRAVAELDNETNFHSVSFSGRGNKQTGWGKGKVLGGGKWQYINGKWEQVN